MTTKAEKSNAYDGAEAVALPWTLAHDAAFLRYVRELEAMVDLDEREQKAVQIAKRYVPNRSANGGQDSVKRLLLTAAAVLPPAPLRPPGLLPTLLAAAQQQALGLATFWSKDEDELDAKRTHSRRVAATAVAVGETTVALEGVVLEGAKLVARRGANRCLRCERPVSQTGRRGRAYYCSPCSAKIGRPGRDHDERAIREALDAASGHRRRRRNSRRD